MVRPVLVLTLKLWDCGIVARCGIALAAPAVELRCQFCESPRARLYVTAGTRQCETFWKTPSTHRFG